MNQVVDLLLRHRSIRRFADDPVPEADVRAAVQAGQMASTSSAMQAYALLEITTPEVRERLVELTGNQSKVARAPRFFVVLGDTRRHRQAAEKHGEPYDARLEAFLVATIDASLFAQNVCVAFESMGYGICYIGGLRNQLPEVDALLGLPPGVYPLFGLCVGRPAQDPSLRPRLPVAAVWMKDRYAEEAPLQAELEAYDETYRAYRRERGAEPSSWTEAMAKAHRTPSRASLASYYASKGARLD